MKKNIGTADRAIRFIIALLLLAYALWQKSWIAGGASVFVFYEATAGWCIYYYFTGKSSCSIQKSENDKSQLSSFTKLLLCLALCISVEFSAAWFTQQSVSTWYPLLNKPWWTPPDLAFPIIWTIIYISMGISLWLVTIDISQYKRLAYLAFGIQLFLNFLWSYLFFYLQMPQLALIDISFLVIAIVLTIGAFWKHSFLAGLLLFPYIIWVTFALSLNLYIFFFN